MALLDFKPLKRATQAGYKPVEGAFESPKTSSSLYDSTPETPEPPLECQCRIKIHCEKKDLNALTVGVWTLGKTQADKSITQWTSISADDGTTLLTAFCFEEEEKTLYHDAFHQAGHPTSYTITSTSLSSEQVNAEFVPVKLAIQPQETRLAWATKGYFYHFVEHRLVKEYKVVGNGRWTLQLTRSTHGFLTDELISEHHYPSILLPYQVEGQDVSPQHLLYRKEKLTAETLANINPSWLNEHALTLDLARIVGERKKSLLPRQPASEANEDDELQASEQMCQAATKVPEVPSPIESLMDVHLLGDVWGTYHELKLSDSAVNIMEDRTVSNNVPVLNPGRMYWPPYNPLATKGKKDLKVIYTQDVIKFAVLTPDEWAAFFDTFDYVRNFKSTATGLYDARETAKALGGVGVSAFVRKIDGVEYLVLKNYDKWSQTLLHGNVFRTTNAQVVKLGLGALDSTKSMAKYVKVSAPLEILVGSAINVLQYILNDEYTLSALAVDEAKILMQILLASGLALGAGALFPVLVSTAMYSGITLVVSNAVIWTADKITDFEKKLIQKVWELSK
ncbi:hypothetical protein L1D15_00160 [Vibrio sp. Isolate25]|uniref:hypothetical protein n=1 Tax=Vibrio sp. Isolate25 TaxID=2908535 RepID=UPI001EFC803A|nr:hypothetical protein [Vibrio sp. Isolate25]MCG9595123.1 hypothetical protein [Vibrio sp. Isolate25]